MLFDYMVTGGTLPFNPAASVRGPKYVVKKGKTPVMQPDKEKIVWLHHQAEEYLDAYLEAAGPLDAKAPLFQSVRKNHRLTGNAMSRTDMLRVVKGSLPRGRVTGGRFVITRFAEPASSSSCKTAARSKPPRAWRGIPIRAPLSSTIGGRI